MVASSKNLYSILERFGDEIGQEKVWSNYMLLLKCYEFRNKGQTDQRARKTQVRQTVRYSDSSVSWNCYSCYILRCVDEVCTTNCVLKTSLQNTPASNGGPGFAVRVNPSKRQTQQNTIPQDHPKPSDWKHIQESFEEKIQNYEERIRKLSEENNNLRSETAVQRKQLEEKEKRIEELTTR